MCFPAYPKKYTNKPSGICQACFKNPATQFHHKFSRVKWAVKLYGALIDDERNLQAVCSFCHASHASVNLIHWDEKTFCENLNIEVMSKLSTRV
jgi:hypothetical protein